MKANLTDAIRHLYENKEYSEINVIAFAPNEIAALMRELGFKQTFHEIVGKDCYFSIHYEHPDYTLRVVYSGCWWEGTAKIRVEEK